MTVALWNQERRLQHTSVVVNFMFLVAWPLNAQMFDQPLCIFSKNVSGEDLTEGRELVDCPP